MKISLTKFISFTFILILPIFNSTVASVYAQSEEQEYNQDVPITSDPGLKLKLSQPLEQDFKTKTFKLSLEIDSLIDSNRIGVEWRFPEQLLDVKAPEKDVVSVVQGQKTSLVKEFTPKARLPVSIVNRRVEIAVVVNGFVAGENYLSSEKIVINFTPDMVIQPELSNYSSEKKVSTIKTVTLGFLALVIFVAALIFAVKQLRSYLNTNDVT